jgi:tripartite ATP-independent transporter DctM subunit
MASIAIPLILLSAMIGVPIAFALMIGPLAAIIVSGDTIFMETLLQRFYSGMHQYPILAIPLFLLAGDLLNAGRITERLVAFANAFVGHWRGGLAQVTNVTNVIFAGLSGSAVADATALGSVLVPAMEKQGYTRSFAAALTAAGSLIGPIIPPSIIMILYAFVTNVSIGALFAAGVVPGLMMGGSLMLMTAYMARKRNFPWNPARATLPEFINACWRGLPAVLMPVGVIGGILGGFFTATEAAAVATAYAIALGFLVTKELTIRKLVHSVLGAGIASGCILLIIAAATMFAWLLTILEIPQHFTSLVLGLTDSPYIFLLLVNVLLFIIGCFIDAGPAILIIAPILMPAIVEFGIEPVHFALVMCLNLTIGLATPPFGMVLFAISGVTKVSVGRIVGDLWPFLACHVVLVMFITYIPAISLFLPRLLGYI